MMMFFRSLLFVSAFMVVEAQQVPTSAPTVAPTFAPTVAPTFAPTFGPTFAPSDFPSDVPSSVPSTSMPSPEPSYPICYICGEDKVVGKTKGMLVDFTCAQAELAGLRGRISETDCSAILNSGVDSSSCGCVAPSDFDCGPDSCTPYPSISDIQLATEYRKATICMCPGLISPDSEGCSGSLDDTITIPANKDVTMECANDPNAAGCKLECPNAAFIVEGDLTLQGNGGMILSGGDTESRIAVEAGGKLTMDGVSFVETSAVFQRRRDLSETRQLSVASGSGAGVYNAGKMTVTDCKFYNCTAQLLGGAIWTNNAAIVEECEFKDNQATSGGAINVASGTARVAESVFEGNSASVNEDYANIFVGNTATVDSCGNDGLESELGAGCSSSTAARVALVLSVFVGSLSLVMAL